MRNLEDLRKDLNLLKSIVIKKTKLDDRDFGLCPFHEETTPSFHIFNGLDRARYHCFGCGADGDIFNYLQKTEYLTFTLALKKLESISPILPFPPEPPEPTKLNEKDKNNLETQHLVKPECLRVNTVQDKSHA